MRWGKQVPRRTILIKRPRALVEIMETKIMEAAIQVKPGLPTTVIIAHRATHLKLSTKQLIAKGRTNSRLR